MRPLAARAAVSLLISGAVLALVAGITRSRSGAQTAAQPPAAEVLELRNLGISLLENEKPEEAATTFLEITRQAPADPLGFANLAIARLRTQNSSSALASINLALTRARERPDLLAIKADVAAWMGEGDTALALYRQAASAAPDDPRLQYALFRHAETQRSEAAAAAAGEALERLARLRPENLVVLLERGRRAVEAGDRAAATQVYLRVRELLWQAQPLLQRAMDRLREALEAGDLARARTPAIQLGNALKSEPMFKTSLSELHTGVQGIPVTRFVAEPPPTAFGEPLDVTFAISRRDPAPARGAGLVVADLDGDGAADTARTVGDQGGGVELRLSSADAPVRLPAPGAASLELVDLDNDGFLDLLAYGPQAPLVAFRGAAGGAFAEATAAFGLQGVTASALTPIDFDHEGDLDLLVVRAGQRRGATLFRNTLEGPLQDVGARAFPPVAFPAGGALAADLDRAEVTDLLLWGADGVLWLDNQHQGSFADRTARGGLDGLEAVTVAAAGDLDNDGLPELVLGGRGVRILRNVGGRFEDGPMVAPAIDGEVSDLELFDLDNDGRLDLAVVAGGRLHVLQQRDGRLVALAVADALLDGVSAVESFDLDGDGDLDLLAAGSRGLIQLTNQGGNANHWLEVSLRGLTRGNDKNNFFGRGATLELRVGAAYQFREVTAPITHLGLGRHATADSLRAVWANGVPQHRVAPERNQLLVEEQVLKGSCPFLYTWDGERVRFVTDLLWGAPLGMPVAPGVWAGADPTELVRVDGAVPRDGAYDLRITEELWEAAYFDHVRLWVVDHPQDAEAASSLRVFAGAAPEGARDERVLLTGNVRPVVAAWDGRGREVTARVRARDDVYADGYPVGAYQGIVERPWSFTFDLGEAPEAPIRLLLDGWIFPADASLNLASAQRSDLELVRTRLEFESAEGWRILVDPMGFPAGKTKTMVVDTPELPAGARRLRIVSSQWLHWDRVAWSTAPRDHEATVVAKLLPSTAELRERGFSKLVRRAPNAPHEYDYDTVSAASPWQPLAGRYTRTGDVVPLLERADDLLVVLAAGDEVRLRFDARDLPPPAPGMRRTVFLESHGWDKDADKNTWRATTMEPLPFRAMSGYPYAEPYPDTPELRRYRDQWLTREIAGPPRGQGESAPGAGPTPR
ncbi:MAG TPA: FG-GAP-like repeat-containing protein [Thermoanaerobaculia bacterium]|nr:FG-GAP-like repeat-containing protein [Thermoanaerobaculia bacterium]